MVVPAARRALQESRLDRLQTDQVMTSVFPAPAKRTLCSTQNPVRSVLIEGFWHRMAGGRKGSQRSSGKPLLSVPAVPAVVVKESLGEERTWTARRRRESKLARPTHSPSAPTNPVVNLVLCIPLPGNEPPVGPARLGTDPIVLWSPGAPAKPTPSLPAPQGNK